jgi:hypothetical protein
LTKFCRLYGFSKSDIIREAVDRELDRRIKGMLKNTQ